MSKKKKKEKEETFYIRSDWNCSSFMVPPKSLYQMQQ